MILIRLMSASHTPLPTKEGQPCLTTLTPPRSQHSGPRVAPTIPASPEARCSLIPATGRPSCALCASWISVRAKKVPYLGTMPHLLWHSGKCAPDPNLISVTGPSKHPRKLPHHRH